MSRVSKTLFIRNLPYSCTKEKLEETFSDYGPIKQCFIVIDRESKKSRGIGYVTYTLKDDCVKAKEQNVSIDGRRLLLDFADISKKVKQKKKRKADETLTKDTSDPESDNSDDDDDDNDDDDKPNKKSTGKETKDKEEKDKMSNLKYHRAKIVLLTGLGSGLTEEKLNTCLQNLNVKHVAEIKLISGDSGHVKFKCIRDAKRAVNRLHNHEYKGSTLSATQLSRDTANIPQKVIKKCRLIVRNLAFKCQENHLKMSFEQFGEITEVTIPRNRDGQSLGFGFVQFTSLHAAKKALDEMNSKKMKGRPVAVDWAIPKSKYETNEDPKQSGSVEGSDVEDDEGSFSGENDMSADEDKKPTGKRKRDVKDDEGFDDDDDEDDDDEDDDDDEMESDNEKGEEESEGNESHDDDDDDDEKEDVQKEKEDVDEGKTVFIRNLSYDTEEDKLGEFFEKFGELAYARIVVDFNTEHSKGMAFVKFKSKESADKCLEMAETEDFMLDERKLYVALAVSRQRASEFNEKKKREKKDNRNLYLAREGYIRPGTQAAVGMSSVDLKKRTQVEMVKRQKLKNINVFVSTLRLCIRNIPTSVNDKQLKSVYLKAAQDKSAKITECRVMRDLKRVSSSGMGKSLGYGFVSFTEHQHAMNALRHTNNNPDIFGDKKRLIVEFSLENRKALEAKERRINRQILKKEILKKKAEAGSSDKKTKIDKEKLIAIQKPQLSLIKLSDKDKKSKANLPKGLPTHMGPKIRHKARPSQQVKKGKKSKKVHQPRPRGEEGPSRKKQKMSKKRTDVDKFDKLVSNYKTQFMKQGKNKKWYD